MVDAPEKIWSWNDGDHYTERNPSNSCAVEYIRTNIAERQFEELRMELGEWKENAARWKGRCMDARRETVATDADKARLSEALAEILSLEDKGASAHGKWGDAYRIARAALSGSGAGGWRLVPAEATVEMVAAFWRQKNTGTQEIGVEPGNATSDFDAYRAMIAVAPTATGGRG